MAEEGEYPMSPTAFDYADLVQEARAFEFPSPRPRREVVEALPEPAPFNLIHAITGIRRCGKTFYAFQLIQQLLSRGVPRDRVFYFNFSDDRLRPTPPALLNDVVEEYWRQVPSARSEGCYLFLDEVQEADDWEGFCQRIAERERVTLVVTGSSSKLSADEIASRFRGRLLEHPMRPLSFVEFCLFNGIYLPDADDLALAGSVAPAMRSSLEAAFDRYLIEGGFPGAQGCGGAERMALLQTYVRDVVVRDVVDRYPRAGVALANQVALYGLRNTGCELSVNSLVASLKKVGYPTTWETVSEVSRLLEQAHLYDGVSEYSTSFSPSSTATRKVYAVDTGMAHAVSRASQHLAGKRLETAVHNELARRAASARIDTVCSLTVPGAKREKVDFVVGDALSLEPYGLIQVTVDMTADRTRAREIGSLASAMRYAGVDKGLVVTLRERSTIEVPEGMIEVVPAWHWALMDGGE